MTIATKIPEYPEKEELLAYPNKEEVYAKEDALVAKIKKIYSQIKDLKDQKNQLMADLKQKHKKEFEKGPP